MKIQTAVLSMMENGNAFSWSTYKENVQIGNMQVYLKDNLLFLRFFYQRLLSGKISLACAAQQMAELLANIHFYRTRNPIF